MELGSGLWSESGFVKGRERGVLRGRDYQHMLSTRERGVLRRALSVLPTYPINTRGFVLRGMKEHMLSTRERIRRALSVLPTYAINTRVRRRIGGQLSVYNISYQRVGFVKER